MRPWLLEEVNLTHVRGQRYEVAVLPLGATEPHNLHLPYGNDFLTVRQVGERICAAAHERGARVLLLPTIPFGVDTNLMSFPLTIHVGMPALAAVIGDVLRSLERHGIRKLVLLNGHGGNEFKPLLREWYGSTRVFVCLVDWWKVGLDQYDGIFAKPDDHAGEMETSVGLALYPDLVKLDQMTDGATRTSRLDAVRRGWVQITRPWHLLTDSSGVGDPRAATAEKGERYLQVVVARLADFLCDVSAESPDEPFPF